MQVVGKKTKKNALAKMLLKYRIDNDLRCEDMGKMLGMTKQQYNLFEYSTRLPYFYTIRKLANVMNMEEEEMYKTLMKTDKRLLHLRTVYSFKKADISDDDLFTIIKIVQKYDTAKEKKEIKEE